MRFEGAGIPRVPQPGDARPRLLYLHIPFCERLCPYCSFHRITFKEPLTRKYFQALRREIRIYHEKGYQFEGIYAGGGTPTVLIDELAETLNLSRELFPIRDISVETNPNHLTEKNIDVLRQCGVKRLSVGVQTYNDEMLKNMGGLTKIEVYNYGSQNINGQEVKLDNEAVQRFRKIDHVTAVTPYYQPDLNLYVEAGKNNRYRASYVWSVLGLDPDTMPLLDNKLESGDWPKSGVNYGKDVIPVVVGKEFLYQFEDTRRSQNSSKRQRWSGETDANGNQLPPFVDATKDTFTLTLTNGDTENPKTQSYKLKIVGVVSEESEDYMLQYGITFRLNDLLMLSEAYSKLAKTDFNPKKVTYNEVYIKVDDIKNVDKICDTLKEEGYQISSMVDYRKQMQQQTAQRQLRLAGLAAISLFVAALNIANTMTMAIYERTREIGVMKVLGCEIGNIRRMFLIESGMIGFIGGVAGTILSYIISFGMNNMTMIVYGLNTLLMKLGINATIDLSSLMGSSDSMYYGGGMYMSDSGSGTVMSIIPIWLVLAAIGFAVVVGLLSGIVPASRAVRISALEAIRHD